MDIVEKLLNRYKLTFSDDSFEKFSSILKQEDYQKDEIILEQGKISRYMYVVDKGIIRQFYYKEGRNITEHFSCEGNVATCLESVFLKEPTRLAVEAIEPSVIHLLD